MTDHEDGICDTCGAHLEGHLHQESECIEFLLNKISNRNEMFKRLNGKFAKEPVSVREKGFGFEEDEWAVEDAVLDLKKKAVALFEEGAKIRGLFLKLATESGMIVSSAALPADAITHANAEGNMVVSNDGLGFVWIPRDMHHVCRGGHCGCDANKEHTTVTYTVETKCHGCGGTLGELGDCSLTIDGVLLCKKCVEAERAEGCAECGHAEDEHTRHIGQANTDGCDVDGCDCLLWLRRSAVSQEQQARFDRRRKED